MKMVSQLTKQAMSRHRILAGNAAQAACSPLSPAAEPVPASSPALHPVRTLYSQPTLAVPQPAPTPSDPPVAASPVRIPAAEPPHHSIYSQLMLKHDRMSERHLKKN